jgi:4-diphosphocytidyl-2-C-methyl-D-erythritol kinase
MSMTSLSIKAPAKINLFLKVLGKRPDGYHEIYSLVQAVSLYDTLVLSQLPKSGIDLVCESDSVPSDATNLVWQAAELVDREIGLPGGLRIELRKQIPVGAGLGGGSSDAAATLVGLNRLFGLDMPANRLTELAGRLGSDVPLFLGSGQSVISGRGEIVENVELPLDYKVLLIVPDFSVSTSWAYSRLRFPLTTISDKPTFSTEGTGRSFYKSLAAIGNDFVDVIVREHPDVSEGLELLRQADAEHVGLTGSGSAFFGLFDTELAVEMNTFFERRIG